MILIDTQKEEFGKLRDIRIYGKVKSDERFYGDVLFIGLGGIGREVLSNLKKRIALEMSVEDNINFLYIDSDVNAMKQEIEDSKEGIALNATEVISLYRPNLENFLSEGDLGAFGKFLPDDFPKQSIGQDGAKSNRLIGRLIFSNAYEEARVPLFERIQACHEKRRKLDIILVSGTCGGTSAGILSDVAYNIRALARAKKLENVRLGAFLLTPDVMFGDQDIAADAELRNRLSANGCATLKEIQKYMKLTLGTDFYVFESGTHRISIKEDIFESAVLISGKPDDKGRFDPPAYLCRDLAYLLYKMSCKQYMGDNPIRSNRTLLRDAFFAKTNNGLFKVISEKDYKIPIREIENLCENKAFKEAYKQLYISPFTFDEKMGKKVSALFTDVKYFLSEKPGSDITLDIQGLVKPNSFEKPTYKAIKKKQDTFRPALKAAVEEFKEQAPAFVKSYKNKLQEKIYEFLENCLHENGPFQTIEIIGLENITKTDSSKGIISELKTLQKLEEGYTPSGEFARIIESIEDITAKRFFAFPNAKRETENGYVDACIKECVSEERNIIMEELEKQDVFGDIIRILREQAEKLDDTYSQFSSDLSAAVDDLARSGERMVRNIMSKAYRQEFLPIDYVNAERIDTMRRGIIELMIANEKNIDNATVLSVRDEMEKLYKNLLLGIGAYAPEKLIAVAFSDKELTTQDLNIMFASPTNDRRIEIMDRASRAFVEEMNVEKYLCVLREGYENTLVKKKYISLPDETPYFSKAVRSLLVQMPYREDPESITENIGDIEVTVNIFINDVPLNMLGCALELQKAYDELKDNTLGLHADEKNVDMKSYADLFTYGMAAQ